ncbi:MAG: Cu+-exporting ATPase [Candidatus Pseudothioglobus sp.]|jgi:Cu+-exporting ATPase
MTAKLRFDITGMTCGHCVARVKGAIEAVVDDARDAAAIDVVETMVDVELATLPDASIGRVTTDQFIDPLRIQAAIEAAGYGVDALQWQGEVSIPVTGMHCKKCVDRVSVAVAAIAGVSEVAVELDRGLVTVNGNFDWAVLAHDLNQVGYPVASNLTVADVDISGAAINTVSALVEDASQEVKANDVPPAVTLDIQGMSCASCVANVEAALLSTSGTTDAMVNFADETATVVTSATASALIAAVGKAGYAASEAIDESVEDRAGRLQARLHHAGFQAAAALLTGTLLMAGMWFEIMPPLQQVSFWAVVGLLVLAVMIFSGKHFYYAALKAAMHGTTTMDTLIALSTSTAWLYSMLIIVIPDLLPLEARHLFFEAAVFILGFVGLGKALENNAKGKTSMAVRHLLDLQPQSTLRIEAGIDQPVAVSSVIVGDQLRIRPGETVPVDGVVLQGESSVNESMLSGESLPVDKQADDKLIAGTLNQYGMLVMRAEQVGADTVLASIVRLVRQAQNSKPKIARITDKIASIFVPAVLVISALTAVLWLLLGPEPTISYAIVAGMSVLIVACPCAIGLAIPMSIMVGVGRAANAGLLFKNGDALQAASRLTTIVVDKTGTLTLGTPEVTSVVNFKTGLPMLALACSLERLSEHPLADAVTEYCVAQGAVFREVTGFLVAPGGGVSGEIDGEPVAVGNYAFMQQLGMTQGLKSLDIAETVIYVGQQKSVLGYFSLSDQLKPDSVEAVQKLHQLGLKVVMLTGDNKATASKIAVQLNLDGFVAEVAPQDKLAHIQDLQAKGERVAMVGDGINDALALSAADVGFAMGKGADVAIASADIALLGDSVAGVARAIVLSRLTLRNIYQNLAGAFAYNLLLIPVAAGVFYPVFQQLVNPVFAAMAMAASSVTVVLNANRLRNVSLDA